jgi:lipoate-protein ligase A
MKSILNPCTDPHWNMAHDEFLLEGLQEKVFCLWQNRPSVIIGLNQSAPAEVNLKYLEENDITLARRVTGGGAVYHDLGNLNYTIAGPSRELENDYGLMAETLRKLGVPAERSGRNDILVEGRKCSGYAKRLSKDRMMIHGTLMWDVNLEVLTQALQVPGSKLQAAGIASVRSRVVNLKEYLPQFSNIRQFQAALQEILANDDPIITLTEQQLQGIEQMADEKFRRWEWIYGHSPAASFQNSRKFACGTIQVQYTLKHGVFENLSFSGDFLGNRPAEELARQLIGKRVQDIGTLPISHYFDQLTPLEFLTLFQE